MFKYKININKRLKREHKLLQEKWGVEEAMNFAIWNFCSQKFIFFKKSVIDKERKYNEGVSVWRVIEYIPQNERPEGELKLGLIIIDRKWYEHWITKRDNGGTCVSMAGKLIWQVIEFNTPSRNERTPENGLRFGLMYDHYKKDSLPHIKKLLIERERDLCS